MTIAGENEIRERVHRLTGRKIGGPLTIIEDTSDYLAVNSGAILRLAGRDYFVTRDAVEGRFGIDEQPKFWVKYVIDLKTGAKKIIKLVFHEEFTSRIGPFLIRAHRNPQKEIDVLNLVRGHPNFMQGVPVLDAAGNLNRLIDLIPGRTLYSRIMNLDVDHETYFYHHLPRIMDKLLTAIGAVDFLRRHGLQHGDIRTDHLIVEKHSGRYVWIDFDYQVSHADYDLWCLGNVLVFVVGKGIHNIHEVCVNPGNYACPPGQIEISPADLVLFGQNRIANLARLYPYIPARLNAVLMNFSVGTQHFYESVKSLLEDLGEALA